MDYAASEARVEHFERGLLSASPRKPETPSFSWMERSVIHLSRKDAVTSIPDLRDWRVAVARLFAIEPASPLANKHLEELRRFAILVRVQGDPGDDTLDRFLDAGYTVEQAGLIHRILHEDPVARRHKRFRDAFWIAPLLVAVGMFALLHNAGEGAVSMVVGGLISVIWRRSRDHVAFCRDLTRRAALTDHLTP